MSKFASIIIVHWAMNPDRSGYMRLSLDSLFSSLDYPCEIIVIDNGGSYDDSDYLVKLNLEGKINTYIRNAQNMSFGYARNQGLAVAQGDYLCIADNDIVYKPGWLSSCIKVLDAFPEEKIYATPIYNVAHWLPKYWIGRNLEIDGEIYRLNSRAGSNCFVVRRSDMEIIGKFKANRVAGTRWTERAINLQYFAAITPKILIRDVGFRKGYDYKKAFPIKMILTNGDEIYFNQDEFKKKNGQYFYLAQRGIV